MGKIVSLGEVVADIYRGESAFSVEMPFTARPGGAPANVAVGGIQARDGGGFRG